MYEGYSIFSERLNRIAPIVKHGAISDKCIPVEMTVFYPSNI